jgi:hypothetical protein
MYGDQQQPAQSTSTPGGRWVYRDSDVHRCRKPGYSNGVKTGDRWECGTCHKVWRVKVNDDQRDGPWITWDDYESWKSGLFVPGTR